jgi:S-adenosylmethionine synthetase, C-terminal domain
MGDGPPWRWGVLRQGSLEGRPLRRVRGSLGREERGRGRAGRRCEVQIAYAIGVATPVSRMVETFGTETVDRELIERLIDRHFDLFPGAIREARSLQRPIYSPTAV